MSTRAQATAPPSTTEPPKDRTVTTTQPATATGADSPDGSATTRCSTCSSE